MTYFSGFKGFAVVSLPNEDGSRDRHVMAWPCREFGARLVAGPYRTLAEAQAAQLRWAERQLALTWLDDTPHYVDVVSKEGLV